MGRAMDVGGADHRCRLGGRDRHPLLVASLPCRSGTHVGGELRARTPAQLRDRVLDGSPGQRAPRFAGRRAARARAASRPAPGRGDRLRAVAAAAGGDPVLGCRARPAVGRELGHLPGGHTQPGLRHYRGRPRAGEPHALRAGPAGEAAFLPGGGRAVPPAHPDLLLAPDRRHQWRRQARGQAGPLDLRLPGGGRRRGGGGRHGGRCLQRRPGAARAWPFECRGHLGRTARRGFRPGIRGARCHALLLRQPRVHWAARPELWYIRRGRFRVLSPPLVRLAHRPFPRALHRPGRALRRQRERDRVRPRRRPARG